MTHDQIAFGLEAAISGEMLLFAAFLLTNRLRPATLLLLAGLSGALAAMIGGNLLIAALGWPWLGDVVLACDLIAPALFFLYVREVRLAATPMGAIDLLNLLPACAGIILWKTGLLTSMDAYVIGCWTLYLCAAAFLLVRDWNQYAPVVLKRFIALLTATLFAIVALRVVMAVQAAAGAPFQEGTAYLIVLAAVFLVTCQLLFTSLHYPNLLTAPGSYVKYASSGLSASEMREFEQRLTKLFEEQKPFLNPDLTLSELAVLLDAPARRVSQFVNSRFGMNIPAYLNKCRIEEAARLLREAPERPVKVIMFEAGFASKNLFHREFQRNMGQSPTEFREAVKG